MLRRKLVSAGNFFLGDAIEIEIYKWPSIDLMPIDALCGKHSYPQFETRAPTVQRTQQLGACNRSEAVVHTI
jgi:hypothetical protein